MTRMRCGGFYNDHTFSAETKGERILKMGQHMAKLWARVGCPVLFIHRVEHIVQHKNIPNKKRYTMNTYEKILNKSTDKQFTFHGSVYPKQISHHTHRSSVLPGGPLGGLPFLSLTNKFSWIHL